MRKLYSKIIVLSLLALLCSQCNIFKTEHIDVEIRRFDSDLFSLDTSDLTRGLALLDESYPLFYPVYMEGIMGVAYDHTDYASYEPAMKEFISHPSMLGLMDTVNAHFPDLADLEKQFGNALSIYNKEFPHDSIPEIVAFVSEFGNKAVLFDGGIGIGLDMFLGSNYPYYHGLQIPDFIIRFLTPDAIVPSAMKALADGYLHEISADYKMLDIIIAEGKKLYFASEMLPKTQKSAIIEYTPEQYDWCMENEFQIWSYFVDHNLLYSTNQFEYRRYIDPAPSSLNMPSESPGRTGIWIGWRIVEAYMQKNRNVSLAELMAESDIQKILNDSGYKPK